MNPYISIIVAIDQRRAIGYKNQLLFHLPADMKRFKELTTGNTIIMGRHTFESLPKGALPNRRNIILSTQGETQYDGAECYQSLEEALNHCNETDKVFVIGGASVYRQAINIANELDVTEIHSTALNADTFFPEINHKEWQKISCEQHLTDEKNLYDYDFVTYKRL
jgi:dihydrofolate reductase